MTSHITLNSKEYHIEIPTYQKSLANPMAAKLGQGAGDYGDLTDWSAWLMDSWAAGVGQEDPEAGGSLFATADTRFERQLILPPRVRLSSSYTDYYQDVDNIRGTRTIAITDDDKYLARAYTAPSNQSVAYLWAYVLEPPSSYAVTVGIWTDSGGAPGSVIRDGNYVGTGLPLGGHWVRVELSGTAALTSGTNYWIVVSGTEVTLPVETVGAGVAAVSGLPYAWASDPDGFFFAVQPGAGYGPESQAALILFNNYVYLAAGAELWRWDGGIGLPYWTLRATLGGAITSMVVYDDALHLAANGLHHHMDAAETMTVTATAATLLCRWGGYLYRANGAEVFYANATGGAWSTPAIRVGDGTHPVRGMAGMGGVNLYCATDEALYYIGAGDFVFGLFPFPAIDSANGRGMLNFQGDLYVPLTASGLIRVTDGGQILRMGLDLGEGLPGAYAGNVVGLAATATNLLALVAGDEEDQRGSVWAWNGQGWHFLAETLPGVSASQGAMALWRTGVFDDVLFVTVGHGYVARIPLEGATENPVKSTAATYAPYGWVEMPAYYGTLREVAKDIEGVYVDGDALTSGQSVTVCWRDDDSTAWETLGSYTYGGTALGTEIRWTTNRPNTKQIRLGLLLHSTDETATPLIRAMRLKYMAMVKDRHRWAFTVRVGLNIETVGGAVESRTAAQQRTDLWAAASSVPPVTFVDLDGTSYQVKVLDAIETVAKYQRDLLGTVTYDGHMNLSLLQVA